MHYRQVLLDDIKCQVSRMSKMKSTFLISALFAAVVSLGSSSAIHPTPMDDEPSRDMPIRCRLGNARQHVKEDDLEVIHNFPSFEF